MQTHPEPEDRHWPVAYDAQGYPIFHQVTALRPSTTVIIYDPYVAENRVTWRVLCHQRRDNHLWGFLGGAQEIGESLQRCARRETFEETGLAVVLERLVCVDSDPAHGSVMQYPDGNVVQYTNCTFTARCPVPWSEAVLVPSEESTALAWFRIEALPEPFSRLHRWRLAQALQVNQYPPVR